MPTYGVDSKGVYKDRDDGTRVYMDASNAQYFPNDYGGSAGWNYGGGPISGSGSGSSSGSSGSSYSSGGEWTAEQAWRYGSIAEPRVYGMPVRDYVQEVNRKLDAGIPLTSPLSKRAYNLGIDIMLGLKPGTTSAKEKAEEKAAANADNNASKGGRGDIDELKNLLLDLIGQQYQQVSYPYQQMLEQMLANQNLSTPLTPAQIQERALAQAGLIYDPQVAALNDALEQYRQAAESQRRSIEAAYAGVTERTTRMMEEAAQQALESAIARGGGRAGAVEWLVEKAQQPIIERQQQLDAEQAAKLAAVADALALAEQQTATQTQRLAELRGQYTAQQAQALEDLEYSRRVGDWERAFSAAQSLANMATEHQRMAHEIALNLLPYLAAQWEQQEGVLGDMFNSLGYQPTLQSGVAQQAVPVREYVAQYYPESVNSIQYDSTKGEVVIGRRRIPIAELGVYGGYLDPATNRVYLPPNQISKFLGG